MDKCQIWTDLPPLMLLMASIAQWTGRVHQGMFSIALQILQLQKRPMTKLVENQTASAMTTRYMAHLPSRYIKQ